MPRRPSRPLVAVAAALAAATAGLSLPTAAHAAAPLTAVNAAAQTPTSHTVTYDGYSLMIDGKRTYIWSGEFHYSRLPSPSLWLDRSEEHTSELQSHVNLVCR